MYKGAEGKIDAAAKQKRCNYRPKIPVTLFYIRFKKSIKDQEYKTYQGSKANKKLGKITISVTV